MKRHALVKVATRNVSAEEVHVAIRDGATQTDFSNLGYYIERQVADKLPDPRFKYPRAGLSNASYVIPWDDGRDQ